MYEVYCKLRDLRGVKDADVVRATGITKSTFSDWKSGRSEPKKEKLQKIADFFDVSLDYLMTGEEQNGYYLNEETAKLAQEMFEAGENLQERTAEQVLTQDYKVFASGGIRFGVGQGSYVSAKNREMAKEMLQGEMEQVLAKENVDMIFYLVTNILDQSSEVLFAGKDADLLLSNAFHCLVKKGQPLLLKGVVSRKKQFIPAMIGGIQNQ